MTLSISQQTGVLLLPAAEAKAKAKAEAEAEAAMAATLVPVCKTKMCMRLGGDKKSR